MNSLPKHLGGHGNITHLDEGVLDHLIEHFNIKTMLDIGCGPGGMVKLAKEKGIDAVGVDGDYTIKRAIPCMLHDFTKGSIDHTKVYDLGWSIEFLEHIPEEYISNFMPSFQACKHIFITFSNNPKPTRHYNAQEFPYWLKKFNAYGFFYDVATSMDLRRVSTMQREFVRNSGSFFLNSRYMTC